MSVFDTIKQANTAVVHAGGLAWKVQRIKSEDLIRVGAAMLAMMPSQLEGDPGEVAAAEAQINAGDIEGFTRMFSHVDAVVCASLCEASADEGQTWEPIRMCLREDEESREAKTMWIENLPAEVRRELFFETMRLCSDNGRLAKALANFRGRSEHPALG